MPTVTERDKIDAAIASLKERGINSSTAAPPIWRLCWRTGFLIPPPHFLGFFPLFVLAGFPFGIGLNLTVAVFLLVVGEPLAWPLATIGVSGGLLFGAALASYYRWSAQRMGLPPWSEFHSDFDAPEDSW